MIANVIGSTGNHYQIDDQGSGHITCTCPDFLYRRAARGEYCKHIMAYVELAASTARKDIMARARAAKQAKRAAMVKRAAIARAARALKHAGIENWNGHVLGYEEGNHPKITIPKSEPSTASELKVVATWRESCASVYVLHDSYRTYKN